MLVLTRKFEEEIDIIAKDPRKGDHIIITVLNGWYEDNVRICIGAPKRYDVHRREFFERIGGDNYIKRMKQTYFDNGGGI